MLLRLQKDMDSQDPLTTDNIKAVISVSTATRGLSPDRHGLHSSLIQRHLLSQDLLSACSEKRLSAQVKIRGGNVENNRDLI